MSQTTKSPVRRALAATVAIAACLAVVFVAGASASTITTTNCHVSAHYAPAKGSVSCGGHYSVSLRVCAQVRGAHGKWYVIKGDCSYASGKTPGKISATVSRFKEKCNRTYRIQAIGTVGSHHSSAYYGNFGTTCIGGGY
jgi:hypothetical protein